MTRKYATVSPILYVSREKQHVSEPYFRHFSLSPDMLFIVLTNSQKAIIVSMEIHKSASKIVFILMAVAVVVLTFVGKVDPKDFMMLAGMAFSFYFANKGETSGTLPYAGK